MFKKVSMIGVVLIFASHTALPMEKNEDDSIEPSSTSTAEQEFRVAIAPHLIPYMHFTGIGPALIGINLDLDYGNHTVGINRTLNTWSGHYKYYFFAHQDSWYLGIHHHTDFLGQEYFSTSVGGTVGYIWDAFYTEVDSHQFISPSHLRPFLIFVPEIGWRFRF